MTTPRTIQLQQDYGFRPTLPMFHDIPSEYRDGLEGGEFQLVLRRSVTPNAWYIVQADFTPNPDAAWPSSQTMFKLGTEAPDLALFKLQDESRSLVDYGIHMRAYVPMAQTSTFDDQGKPEWSRYELNFDAVCRHGQRLLRAENAARSFNRHIALDRRVVSALTDEEVLVLALGKDDVSIWMYRSLASTVFHLVRAGHGTVLSDGRFLPSKSSAAIAAQVRARREIRLAWTNPPSIEKRLRAYRCNPRRRDTNFKGKLPELAYPIG